MKKYILIIAVAFVVVSCTKNQIARKYGGTENIELKPNEVLINMSWDYSHDLWILTKDTISNKMYFRERSSWGIWQGEIIVNENK